MNPFTTSLKKLRPKNSKSKKRKLEATDESVLTQFERKFDKLSRKLTKQIKKQSKPGGQNRSSSRKDSLGANRHDGEVCRRRYECRRCENWY